MKRIVSLAAIAIATLFIARTTASAQTEVPIDPQLQAELESWKPAPPKMAVAVEMALSAKGSGRRAAARSSGAKRGRGGRASQAVASEENFDAVLDWLAEHGFKVIEGERSEHSYVRFTSTAEQTEKTFKVKLIASPDGRRYTCRGEPAVPAALVKVVSFVTIGNVETYESAR
ncbi:MAG: protease pro-enzyme activation domain-containing protein [Candidatus Binataceae bacterium]